MPDDPYACLPPERAKAVRTWLSTPLGCCHICGQPVYPTDSRQRDPGEIDEKVAALVHLPCLKSGQSPQGQLRLTDWPG